VVALKKGDPTDHRGRRSFALVAGGFPRPPAPPRSDLTVASSYSRLYPLNEIPPATCFPRQVALLLYLPVMDLAVPGEHQQVAELWVAAQCGKRQVLVRLTMWAGQRLTGGLATILKPGGRLFLLCFSDEEPGTQGPRRVSKKELHDAFANGWVIEAIELCRYG
jgi:hypothetical protein